MEGKRNKQKERERGTMRRQRRDGKTKTKIDRKTEGECMTERKRKS